MKHNHKRHERENLGSISRKDRTGKKVDKRVIVTIIICTLLTAAGQVLIKQSVSSTESVLRAMISITMILGLMIYAIASVLLITALKGSELSVVYPFIALSYVWIALFSLLLFHENISSINVVGIALIIAGVSFIGRGGRK